jgi:hypothetical protein
MTARRELSQALASANPLSGTTAAAMAITPAASFLPLLAPLCYTTARAQPNWGDTVTTNQPPTYDRKACRSCGRSLPPGADVCSSCGAAQSPPNDDVLRPLGGEPLPPPPQPPAPMPPPAARARATSPARPAKPGPTSHPRLAQGAVAFAKELWLADRWFAIVLAYIAIQGVLALLAGSWVGVVIAAIVFWGLLAYNYWVYIIVVFLWGLSLLGAVFALLAGHGVGLAGLIDLAIDAVIFGVLIDRHDQYM